EESAGIPTYSSASDSPEPVENPVTTISTTQASAYENIDNGFGGFVNFSIGRRVNMGKTIKVSIEPFVKLPVGQFKRADMNYTNCGIRIMTSFYSRETNPPLYLVNTDPTHADGNSALYTRVPISKNY